MTSDEFNRRAIVLTLCAVIVVVFVALCAGLFSSRVDNKDIFDMMKHSLDMILVAITGYMGGRAASGRAK